MRCAVYRQLWWCSHACLARQDTSVNTAQLKETRKQLKRHMKNAERTLQDVQTTVQVVEKELHKFPHISESELYERQNLVANSRDRLLRAKDEQASEAVKAKLLADERAKAVRRAGDMGARNDAERENTSFIVDSQARTSLLMQQQDDTLDDLDQAVVRVGHMAGNSKSRAIQGTLRGHLLEATF